MIFKIMKFKIINCDILKYLMQRARAYSPYADRGRATAGRADSRRPPGRRWSQHELAERAGITPGTLIKIERGDLSVRLGTAFEVASLVGVPLFHADRSRLTLDLDRTRARSALLAERVRPRKEDLKDEF